MPKTKPANQDSKKKPGAAAQATPKIRKIYDHVPNRSGCGKKRQPMSGFGVEGNNSQAGSFQRVLQKEHEERELRKVLAANAALNPVVKAIRDNAEEIKALLPKLNGPRKDSSERRLHQLVLQLTEIDAAFTAFGFKSNVTGLLRKDAILQIRMSNGYLRKIVRDALFAANRAYYSEHQLASDAMAS